MMLQLFSIFFKIGLFTFGGGYAMLPMLEREVVQKKGWITHEQMMDVYALSQVTPGIIAINTASFVGHKQKGTWGALFATLGMIMPSILLILMLATVFTSASEYAIMQQAMVGIKIGVSVLILDALFRMSKKSVVDMFTGIISLAVFIASFFFAISPFVLLPIAAIFAILYRRKR